MRELWEALWLASAMMLAWIALGWRLPRIDAKPAPRAKRQRIDAGATHASEPATGGPSLIDPQIVTILRDHGAGVCLPLVLASDYVADLARAPHVLVAGASGAGKSVALHAMIQGLLCADWCDLWLVDPKMVEAAPYRGVRGVRVAFREDAAAMLAEAVAEMERRYEAMLRMGARQWDARALVVVVDEYGDLVLGGARSKNFQAQRFEAREVERMLVRIAQMGRAASVHLVLATQRPSADVVTPLIRANVPARLALRCASAADSRIVRGDAAAYERLREGGGLALWSDGDRLVQAPFVDPYGAQKVAN